uniref:Uncharacterized protein LOC114348578 n=1 Tax=Diabrotica virgifera virgifera TaxID=50390 RepID=A0A6P7GZZ0_DIAVI
MEGKDTVTNIKFENSIVVKLEFIKKEPTPVVDTYIEDHRRGVSDISLDQIKTDLSLEYKTFEQNQHDLIQFPYFNSDINIKPEPTAKGSRSSAHDSFKNEIEEEPDRESTCDTLDDSDLNEYSLKIEIEEEEIKFMPYEEKQTDEIGNY